MPKKLLVEVDLPLVAAHLSQEEGRPVSEAEVREWLVDANFRPWRDRWMVNEPDLGQLDPSEVRSVEDAPEM